MTSTASGLQRRVVVIGAGLSGLAAATELVRGGCEVALLEQRDRPGGRNAGESVDGFSVERELTLLRGSDRRLIAWIHRLGVEARLLPLRPVQIAQLSGRRIQPIDPRSPWGVARISGVKLREALRLIRLPRLMHRYRPMLDSEAPEKAADLDFRSVADFSRLYFGQSVLDRWIDPALAAQGDASELSRAVFLLDRITGGAVDAGTFLLQGSLHELAAAAAESLGVHFGEAVQQVEADGEGSLRVHSTGQSGDQSFEADAVLVATSPRTAHRIAASLLTLPELDLLSGFRAGPTITLSIALERELAGIPQQLRVPRGEQSSIREVLLDPGETGLRAPMGAGLATVAASSDFCRTHARAGGDVIEKALLADFERIYPRSHGRGRFTRLERCDQAVPIFEVGAFRALRRFDLVQRDHRALGRRLYFAGDYLVGPRAEHAVASGVRSARQLLEDVMDGQAK